MRYCALFGLICFTVLVTSCDNIWMEEIPSNENVAMFERMWADIEENYVFFDQKEVDWEAVKTMYLQNVNEELSEEELFAEFAEALSHLQDGHVSLFSGFNTWHYHDLYLNYPENFNSDFVDRTYLSNVNAIGPFIYDILQKNIGYMRYIDFGNDFTDQQLAYLVDYFSNTNGLIVDVRGNLGGAADNVLQLLSFFVEEEKVIGKTIAPDDGILVETDIIVQPNEKGVFFDKEVVLLTNRKCYSSCNVFVGFMSSLDNVSLIGDTTGGGTGIAVASELANGWKYRYSAAKITLADNTEFENGFEPDIHVNTGAEEELQGKDAIIEKAVEILN